MKSFKSKASREKPATANNIQIVQNLTKLHNLKDSKEQQLKRKMIAKQLKNEFFLMKLKATSVSSKHNYDSKNAHKLAKEADFKASLNTLLEIHAKTRSPRAKSQDRCHREPSHPERGESENISFSEASPQLVYTNTRKLNHFEVPLVEQEGSPLATEQRQSRQPFKFKESNDLGAEQARSFKGSSQSSGDSTELGFR